MKKFFNLFLLCKFLIFLLFAICPMKVYPKNNEKFFKNNNHEKLIDTRDYSDIDKFLIKNQRSQHLISFRKTRGKFLARINQLFLFVILITIFFVVLEM